MKTTLHTITRKIFPLLGLLFSAVSSSAFQYNGLEYTVLSTEEDVYFVSVQKIPGDLPTGDLVIPGTFGIDGHAYRVTTIAPNGFLGCRDLTSVSLPITIDTIHGYGFYNCKKLQTITLNEGLRVIGNRAFCNDSALVGTLTIPSTVDSLGDYALANCRLANIRFLSEQPARVEGNNVFSNTQNNARIVIPCGTFQTYSEYFFIREEVGDNIYFWKDKATDLCAEEPMLRDDKLYYRIAEDDHLSVVGYVSRAIDGELRIPESLDILDKTYYVTEVDSNVFNERERRGNIRMTSLVLPHTMKRLNYASFRMCRSLTSVTLNEGLEYIGNRAFCKDSLLREISIPSTVTFMGDYAIGDIPDLQRVYMLPANAPTTDGNSLAGVPPAETCDIVIPCGMLSNYNFTSATVKGWRYRVIDTCDFNDGILAYKRQAGDSAVYVSGVRQSKDSYTSIIIPEKARVGQYQFDVDRVGAKALRGLSNLTSVSIPKSVRHIESEGIRDCPKLTSVHLHEGLRVIGNRAFCQDTSLTMVSIPSTVDSLGGYAFGVCKKLSNIYVFSSIPPKRQANDNNPFNGVGATGTLYVSCHTMNAYKSAWSGILNGWTWGDNCQMDIYHYDYPNAEGLLTEYEGGDVQSILYHRIFHPGQWETLYLPFGVEAVTIYDPDDEEDYDITPWVSGTGGNFWLMKQTGQTSEGYPEFTAASTLEGETPYLIQFKHDYYADKTVTFHSAASPAIQTSFNKQSDGNARIFGNNTMMPQNINDVYLLEEDSTFVLRSETRILHPFECYVAAGAETLTMARRFSFRFRESRVTTDDHMTTPSIEAADMIYIVSGNTLTVHTNGCAVRVYNAGGVLLHSFPQGTEIATMNLQPGYYILTSQYGSQRVVL